MEKEIIFERPEVQTDEINEQSSCGKLEELFELREISVQPSLACNYGPGSSICERGTCN